MSKSIEKQIQRIKGSIYIHSNSYRSTTVFLIETNKDDKIYQSIRDTGTCSVGSSAEDADVGRHSDADVMTYAEAVKASTRQDVGV